MAQDENKIIDNIKDKFKFLQQENHDLIIKNRNLEKEIKEIINGMNNERNQRAKKERELKIEIKALDLQLKKANELINKLQSQRVGTSTQLTAQEKSVSEGDIEVDDDKEPDVLQHFNPDYWSKINELITEKPLTNDILEALIEIKQIKLVILAMKLMTDHNVCLEILQELENIGIVTIEYLREGDLNPQITLINYL